MGKGLSGSMENYIVRIYRRGATEGFVGLVRAVETDEEKPFTSADELLGLLNMLRCEEGAKRMERVVKKEV